MEWLNTWTLIPLVLLLLVVYWYVSIPKNLPPGPIGFPLLGYIPFVKREIYKSFTKLGEKYGKIYHLYLGSQLVIVLNDFDVIEEGLKKQGDIFAGRPKIAKNLGFLNDWFGGIVLKDEDYSKQHRRFIMQNLKDNGVGKSTLEPLIMDEINHFLKEVQDHNGQPFKLKDLGAMSIANNIQLLITGQRYDYNDPKMQEMIKSMKELEEMTNMINYFVFFPWANSLVKLGFHKYIKKGSEINQKTVQVIENALSDAKNKFISGQSDNYLQSYLTERDIRLRKNSKENIFTNEGLINNTRDLLLAGIDTSASTLAWGAIYLILYPEVQKRMQQEIDQAIGRHREPTYSDRSNTPYTEATILEIHRFATIAPCGIPHRTLKSTTLRGYNIPKDAMVIPYLWAAHNDPKLWGDPENFRPERFLNSNGECVKPKYFIPFSIGKRACLGESLAKMEIYLYFVSILQRFNIVAPNGENPSLGSIYHVILIPTSELFGFELRKNE